MSLRRRITVLILTAAKWLGFFRLAELLTANQLRILCFHGLSFTDEHEFRPGLFMRPDTVRKRFAYLRSKNIPVLDLGDALTRMYAGTLPRLAAVITFDDGFYDNYALAAPLLKEFALPATIYITTYYVEKQNPIFRLAVQYMFWRTKHKELRLQDPFGLNIGPIDLSNPGKSYREMFRIIDFGETKLNEDQRVELAKLIGEALEVSYDELVQSRRLSLVTAEEMSAMARAGIDIQLHTHRHMLPEVKELAVREIADNRRVFQTILQKQADHLCYPSGIYSAIQWPWLEELRVASGTTCERGFNTARTHRLGLNRFLDGEAVAMIQFESEISGFNEILRSARRLLQRSKQADNNIMIPQKGTSA